MADNNIFSVRLEEQDKEKLLELIQESGRSNKEFMSTLLSAYELNKTKVEIPDLAKDIEGLQALTQRINEYYINIGKRIEDTQKSRDMQYAKDIEVYKNRIDVLKADNEKLNGDYESLQQAYNNSCGDLEEYRKQLDQLQEIQESNKDLINEYKSKIDTLSGIIEEYKGYKSEIETVKSLLSDANTKIMQQDNVIKEKDFNINNLNGESEKLKQDKEKDIEKLKADHEQEVKTFTDKAELNKKISLLDLKEDHQKAIQELNYKHNIEVETYQAKYKSLLEEMEKVRATHTTKKNSISDKQSK